METLKENNYLELIKNVSHGEADCVDFIDRRESRRLLI